MTKTTTTTRDTEAFLEQMRARFRNAQEAVSEIHADAERDFKFRLGDQWDPAIEAQRKEDGRPCYTINRIPEFLRQVTGQQKKQRPAVQIAPEGDGADVETAEILQGIVRHIERVSSADEAYDTAFEHMATGGFGYIRILSDYAGDSWDQEVYIRREPNPFAHYPDPHAVELDYSDARYWFVIDSMSREDFDAEYPESELAAGGLQGFGAFRDQAPDWIERDAVQVAEYFWIEREPETIEHPVTGEKRKRTKKTVHWCLTNGVEILDENELPGEYIPLIPVLGEEVRLNGRRHLFGIVRNARAPQELYNLWQSAMAETIALAPKAPFMATPAQIEGYEDLWEQANTSNLPYLPYNPDPKAGGPPQRNFGEPPIGAITQAIQHADNDLKSTTGLYSASLGAPGPEQSGRAILLRQNQGDTSTYGFVDAMARAITHVGRILVQWIPAIYDAARIVRVVNPDGTSRTVPINQPYQDDAGLLKIYDVTVGRYDVSVKSGPSFDSQRQEAAQSMLQLVQAQPALMQVVGDLLVSNFDWPMAKEISERLKKMLPPQLQDGAGGANAAANPQQLQALGMQLQQAHQIIAKLQQDAATKALELQSRERIAAMNAWANLSATEAKINAAQATEMIRAERERIAQFIDNAHDVGMAAMNAAQPPAPQPQPPAPPMPQAA